MTCFKNIIRLLLQIPDGVKTASYRTTTFNDLVLPVLRKVVRGSVDYHILVSECR